MSGKHRYGAMAGTRHKVEVSSSEYGIEEFPYYTRRKAVAGFNRLCKKAKAGQKKDGIAREVRLFDGTELMDCFTGG